jgi:hypothetical protein
MNKIITEEVIRQACSDQINRIRKESNDLLKSTEEEFLKLGDEFKKAVESLGCSYNAFAQFDKIDFSSKVDSLPYGLYVGMLNNPFVGKVFFPAILPFPESNLIGFCIDSSCDNQIMELMQMLAIRISLSVPIEHVNCHFIDLHSFGQATRIFKKLPSRIGDIIEKEKLSSFISNLEEIVKERNGYERNNYDNIKEYNQHNPDDWSEYHFIFFPNIHNRVDKEIVTRIHSLCCDMNASKCGIYFFISVDKSSINKQDSCINDILSIATIIENTSEGLRFSNSIYGKKFESQYLIKLDDNVPSNLDLLIEEIDKKVVNMRERQVSFDKMLEKKIKLDDYWKSDTSDSIVIPIGKDTSRKNIDFILGGKSSHESAIIGGRPGFGKTVLLHDIICNASIIYSPKELSLYLIDCTNGTGFKPYENLPHARFVSITTQREYTHSAIGHLIKEMNNRADLFKKAVDEKGETIEKISKYRKVTGNILPRTIVIIDEFQVLLERKDGLSIRINAALTKLIKEGRKYGIHLIFCTQSFGDIGFNIEQIKLRIAFNLSSYESYKILGADNDAASHLKERGEAIMNDANGDKSYNIKFKTAYTDKMLDYVHFCSKKWKEISDIQIEHHVFDGRLISNLGCNNDFIESLSVTTPDFQNIIIYLGIPMFMRESHSFFTFRRSIGSNLIICGTDTKTACITVALINYQLALRIEEKNEISSWLCIADFFTNDSKEFRYLKEFSRKANIRHLQNTEDLEELINRMINILNNRISDKKAGIYYDDKPYVLTLAYLQNAREMRKDPRLRTLTSLSQKILTILKDGSDYGVHIIVYTYNYKSLEDIWDANSFVSNFGNKLILQNGALAPQMALDAQSLSPGTALLITENHVTTYDQDPIKIYEKMEYEKFAGDEVFDEIFTGFEE